MYATGTLPGILYGLPKIHKNGTPLRPIPSAIGTAGYKLAKFFVPLLPLSPPISIQLGILFLSLNRFYL